MRSSWRWSLARQHWCRLASVELLQRSTNVCAAVTYLRYGRLTIVAGSVALIQGCERFPLDRDQVCHRSVQPRSWTGNLCQLCCGLLSGSVVRSLAWAVAVGWKLHVLLHCLTSTRMRRLFKQQQAVRVALQSCLLITSVRTSVCCNKARCLPVSMEIWHSVWSPFGLGWSDMPFISGCIVMHRGYVEGYYKSSWHDATARGHGGLVENTLLIAKRILYVTILCHNILLVFGLTVSDIRMMSLISVDQWVWYMDQFYILFWIRLESGMAYCLSCQYLHWFGIGIVYYVFDVEKVILSKWWEHSQKLLEKSLSELKISDGENLSCFELGPWDALALWRQWSYLGILFVWEFCDEMFRYCEDNTYIIVIVAYGSCTWSYGVLFIVPEMTLIISMRTTLFWYDFDLHCGLAITVVERLQRYNCTRLTYIDNVE